MFEERSDMNSDPSQPDLEGLLAADEASIQDGGFSTRVVTAMDASPGLRRVTIYGAGLMGFGFALGSLPALVKALPPLQTAVDRAMEVPDLSRLTHLPDLASLSSGSPTPLLVLGAAVAMILTSLLLVARER